MRFLTRLVVVVLAVPLALALAPGLASATPAGAVTEHDVPTAASAPGSITPTFDGNLWFTETTGNAIGRITTDGTGFTEFTLPTRTARRPASRVGQRQHVVHRTHREPRRRITTAGLITELALPIAASGPNGIVTGPDDALSFGAASPARRSRGAPVQPIDAFNLLMASIGPGSTSLSRAR